MRSMSVSYPLVRNRSDFSTRRGVSINPSRSGFSPSSSSIRRIVACIVTVYLGVFANARAGADTRTAAAWQTVASTSDPDRLYRNREDIDSAKKAVEIWTARAASGKDYEASWKIARACYWLG